MVGSDHITGWWGFKRAQEESYVRGQSSGLSPGRRLKMGSWVGRDGCRMRGVAGQFIDCTQNADWEGSITEPD